MLCIPNVGDDHVVHFSEKIKNGQREAMGHALLVMPSSWKCGCIGPPSMGTQPRRDDLHGGSVGLAPTMSEGDARSPW
jgi:hypothetical protein